MNSLNTDQASKSADIRSEMKPEETLSTVSLELIPENNTHSLNLTTTSNASIINHSTRNVESLPTTSVIVNSSYQPSIDEKNSCDKKSNHQNKTVTSAETSKVHDCVTGASNLSESPISENSSKSSMVVDTEYPEVRNDMTSYFATNEIPSVTVASGRSVGGVKANEKDLIRNNGKIQSQQTSSMLLPSTLEPNRKIGKGLFKLGSPCRKLGKENEPTKLSKSRTLDKKLSCDTLKGVEDTNIKTKSGSAENLNKATAAVSPCKSLTLPRNSSSNFGRFPKVTRIWQRIVGKWPKSHLKSGKMTASLDSACQTDDDFFENSGLDSNSGVSCRVAGSCSAHGFCNGNRRSCRVEAENESVRNSESGTSASGGRVLVENGHHASDFQIGRVIGNSGQDDLQDNVSEISARPLVAASSLSSSLLTPVELQTAGVLRGAATSRGAYRNFCCGSCDISSSRRLSLVRNQESRRGVSAICSSNVTMESPAEDIRNEAVIVSPDNDEYPPALYPRGASVSTVHTQVDYIHYLVPGLERIARCSYYWGVMDRYEAERLLDGRPEGTFLLRDSAQDDFLFSVSFRRYGRSLHARIEQGGHQFSFDSHDPSVFSSPSVCELIEHYKDPASCMFFEPLLTTPLVRNQPFSLRSLCRTAICSITSYDSISALPIPHSQRDYLRHYHYKHKVYVRRFEAPPPVPGDTANLRVKQDENEIEECD